MLLAFERDWNRDIYENSIKSSVLKRCGSIDESLHVTKCYKSFAVLVCVAYNFQLDGL